jgi:hypothetical protein
MYAEIVEREETKTDGLRDETQGEGYLYPSSTPWAQLADRRNVSDYVPAAL